MALIKCPECGNEFSSYATRCPQCGFPMEAINENLSQPLNSCPECGAIVDKDSTICPNCGYPFNKEEDLLSTLKEPVVSENPTHELIKQINRKWIIGGGIIATILLGAIILAMLLKDISNGTIYQRETYNIQTTEDWINFVSSAANVEEIDKGYSSMSKNQIFNMAEELMAIVRQTNRKDVNAKAICRAFTYFWLLPTVHTEETHNKNSKLVFSESEGKKLISIFTSDNGLTMQWAGAILDDEGDEIALSLGQYINSLK